MMGVGCAVLHSDTDIDDAQAQAKAGEASLLNALAAIACLMIFSSLLGLLGLRLGGNCAKILLKVYLVLLVLTSAICVCFYTVRPPPQTQRASASSGSLLCLFCSALAVLPSTAQAGVGHTLLNAECLSLPAVRGVHSVAGGRGRGAELGL